MSLSVAIQGEAASFHDIAARQFFGDDVAIVPCDTFAKVFEALSDTADVAVVAIENSLYGSINAVYDLLLKHHYWISGEVYLRIEQCLIGLPGSSLKDIREVHSHPVALAQCEAFLNDTLAQAERFEHHDTAASVADIKLWNDETKAAIASAQAADLHGLNILAREIETNKANYTRFVVIRKLKQPVQNADKTSLVLTTQTDTKPGALYKALGAFANEGINLTMLQSRPIVGKAWHYLFYLDIGSASHSAEFTRATEALEQLGYKITLLGSYPAGRQ